MAKKYDYKKTLIKGGKWLVAILLAGIASQYGGSDWYLALAPVLAMASNALKHKYGIDVKLV